ncbi:hypothetical protein [Wolbachia phage WO]|nr:hypothetical protein [Wolbachia phage WO]
MIANTKYTHHHLEINLEWSGESKRMGCKMSVHIEVNSIESINAKRGKIELAMVKALNKTALWLKAQAAKEISEEKKIKLSLIRKRLRIFKAKTSRLEVLIRANLYDIRASTIGKIQKTRRGSKVGKHEFIGGFAAVMPKGNSGILSVKEEQHCQYKK